MLSLPIEVDFTHIHLTDEQFYQLCVDNPNLALERSPEGVLIIMPPVVGDSGKREANFIIDLGIWNRQNQLGEVFSSSTLFKLPGGGDRSPDAAWVENSRWYSLTPEQRQKFPPIAPDFVIELRSRTDNLAVLQAKMQEYVASGVRLGWLINPQGQTVAIYRPQQAVETRSLPTELVGESVLPGFCLRLSRFRDD